jgi:hypothetical protein
MKNRLRLITPAVLRGLGVEPAAVAPTSPETARLMAGVKLGYAAMLKKDLNRNRRKPSFIGNFNCSRADGSVIVKGCSADVWAANRRRALAEALAYLETEKE